MIHDPNYSGLESLDLWSLSDIDANLLLLLKNKRWRLEHLYKILDDDGNKHIFKMRKEQSHFFEHMWTRNIILKARQIGFTTLIDLIALDSVLFTDGIEAAIIADTQIKAEEIFRRKIKYAYEHLPPCILESKPLKPGTQGSSSQFQFANESVISVGTSMRSGTLQILHSSELAKMCVKDPVKAQEFITGTLEAASSPSSIVFIESTAEGANGYFWKMCEKAMSLVPAVSAGKRKLTSFDYRFHFYPWYTKTTNYISDHDNIIIPPHIDEYFEDLRSKLPDVEFSPGQIAWYAVKEELQEDLIKQEHPSTPEEAFEKIIKGAYFKRQFIEMRNKGRITHVPHNKGISVNTYWDLGINDVMAIWFIQNVGTAKHVIDYHEEDGEGFEHFRGLLDDKRYRYGQHYAPWDINIRELGTGVSRMEAARAIGIPFTLVRKIGDKRDSIEQARRIFSICWFDEKKCHQGLIHLENYRKEFDLKRNCFRDRPLHDDASNAADAWQTFAMASGQNQSLPARRSGLRSGKKKWVW